MTDYVALGIPIAYMKRTRNSSRVKDPEQIIDETATVKEAVLNIIFFYLFSVFFTAYLYISNPNF